LEKSSPVFCKYALSTFQRVYIPGKTAENRSENGNLVHDSSRLSYTYTTLYVILMAMGHSSTQGQTIREVAAALLVILGLRWTPRATILCRASGPRNNLGSVGIGNIFYPIPLDGLH
jgi:hypothetical protein